MKAFIVAFTVTVSIIVVARNSKPSTTVTPTMLSQTIHRSKLDKLSNQTLHHSKILLAKYIYNLPDGFKNGIASGLSAVLAKSILQPFDTIKTVQQASSIKLSPISALVQTFKRNGIIGLWSGIDVTVLGAAPSSAVYFGIYSSANTFLSNIFNPKLQLFSVAISAAIANSVASFIRAPFEVLKQRLQTGAHKTTWDALSHSVQSEGALGLFSKGKLVSQIARDVPYAIICLLSYEILQSAVKKLLVTSECRRLVEAQNEKESSTLSSAGLSTNARTSACVDMPTLPDLTTSLTLHIPPSAVVWAAWGRQLNGCVYALLSQRRLRDALCGSLAGGLSSFLTNPLDVVKTRLMTVTDSTTHKSLWATVLLIGKDEGMSTFFRGAVPRLMHKMPANALFFLFYEAFRSFLGVKMTKS